MSFQSMTLVQAHVSKHPSCWSVLEQDTESLQDSFNMNVPDIRGFAWLETPVDNKRLELGSGPEGNFDP